MSTGIKKKIGDLFQCAGRVKEDEETIFCGSHENFIEYGKLLLEENISLFDGRTNPIRCFSVDELNAIIINLDHTFELYNGLSKFYKGAWEGRIVLVKLDDVAEYYNEAARQALREIAVAANMGTHTNVHKLLGCCLETKIPVLVYEWVGNITLEDRIVLKDENRNIEPLEWKDRLRIAWEISHAIAYLHTAFSRPIIHRDLKPTNVFLDQDNAAKVSNFGLSISIPKGEEFVETSVAGTLGCAAPEYIATGRLAESADVYGFGVLFLVLLTGKVAAVKNPIGYGYKMLINWVREVLRDKGFCEIIDPTITKSGETIDKDLQQQQLIASIELALRCTAEEKDSRPTMVDVATELKNMIMSSECVPSTSGR